MKDWADYGIQIPSTAQGDEIDTTCPQCSKDRKKHHLKCLAVNVEKQTWLCFHCGWSGGLAKGGDRAKDNHWNKPIWVRPAIKPITDLPEKVVKWFAGRGISEQTLADNQIGYWDHWMPQVEGKVPCISFPYFRNGELINRKYRDGKKNFCMEPRAERILYGLDHIDPEKTCVFVEGEVDLLSLWEAGVKGCLSVPDGAPNPDAKSYGTKFDFLDSASELIGQLTDIVIAVDSDAPGQRLREELVRRLDPSRCRFVDWPEGTKDANEYLIAHGAQALHDIIDEARSFPVSGVFGVTDTYDDIVQLYEEGSPPGMSTGWNSLDELYTVRPGELTVISGIPGSGKSVWLDHLLVNLSMRYDWAHAYFSPENQPIHDHQLRLAEKVSMKPSRLGWRDKMTRDDLDEALSWIEDHFVWILPPDDKDWKLSDIMERAKQILYRRGIRGLVIDPWNELEHLMEKGETETQYISKSLRTLRQFARHHGIHLWVVAHPTKLYRDRETGQYPVPTLYDVSGSANFRNKPDNGVIVWRDLGDPESREVWLHVQKIRFRQVGKLGNTRLRYEPATGTYHEYVLGDEGRGQWND